MVDRRAFRAARIRRYGNEVRLDNARRNKSVPKWIDSRPFTRDVLAGITSGVILIPLVFLLGQAAGLFVGSKLWNTLAVVEILVIMAGVVWLITLSVRRIRAERVNENPNDPVAFYRFFLGFLIVTLIGILAIMVSFIVYAL